MTQATACCTGGRVTGWPAPTAWRGWRQTVRSQTGWSWITFAATGLACDHPTCARFPTLRTCASGGREPSLPARLAIHLTASTPDPVNRFGTAFSAIARRRLGIDVPRASRSPWPEGRTAASNAVAVPVVEWIGARLLEALGVREEAVAGHGGMPR